MIVQYLGTEDRRGTIFSCNGGGRSHFYHTGDRPPSLGQASENIFRPR